MQSTKLRAWAIGAMYAALTAGIGAVLSYTEELVRGDAQLLARWGMVILLVIATVRSYIDRTLAQVLPGAPRLSEIDPHDAIERMPGVAETMARALGDVPVARSAPLPAGPNQLAHLEQVADDLEALPRNFSVGDPAGIPTPPVAANPFSQRDTDGRYLVDDAAALARAQEQARSAEEARKKAEEARRLQQEQAERDRLAREQAEQEQRRQAEIQTLEARLATLREGQ